MGAWIEILLVISSSMTAPVAPYMGAWIEIGRFPAVIAHIVVSLPTWERGLKSPKPAECLYRACVAPYMGAWIEIDGESAA